MKVKKLYFFKLYFANSVLLFVLACGSLLVNSGCKKFIEVDPPVNNINSANVYTSEATAAAVLTGIYQKMSKNNSDRYRDVGEISNISLTTGLLADELNLYDMNDFGRLQYALNNLTAANAPSSWSNAYTVLFTINSLIEGVKDNNKLTAAVRQQLLGEAQFLRAFHYFYLSNFYGDVPLSLTTDYKANVQLGRTPVTQVYEQIITDLKAAKELLSGNYLHGDAQTPYTSGSEERVRPTKWAAAALLARTYLYTGDYPQAEAEATAVINHGALYSLESLGDAFLMNNREAIWQLQPVNNGINSNAGEGKLFILPVTGPAFNRPVYLREELVQSFEMGDQRRTNWVGSVTANGITYYYPHKYKVGMENAPTTEYSTILRLAELYLIRAEARAQQGDVSSAADDLNVIRLRAGLPVTTASTEQDLLAAIWQERKAELFTEWGHRWFDLVRSGKADAVLGAVKGADWQPTDKLFPIPLVELQKTPGLTQNPGY